MTAAERRASTVRAVRRLANLCKDEIDLRRVVARQTGWSTDTIAVPVSLTPETARRCSDAALELLIDEQPTDLVYVMLHPLRHDKPMSQAQAVKEYDTRMSAFWGTSA